MEFEQTYNNRINGANVIDVEEVISEPETTKKVSCLFNNHHYYVLHPCFLAQQHIQHPPCTPPPKLAHLGSELTCYLTTEVKHIADLIAWWYERHGTYFQLSRMALNYLTIPGKCFMLPILL